MNLNHTCGDAEGLSLYDSGYSGVKSYTLTYVILQTYSIFMGIKCFKSNLSTWVLSQALIVSMGYWAKTY